MSISKRSLINELEYNDCLTEGKKSKPDYLDFDNDGDEIESMKKALKDRKKKIKEELVGDQTKIDVAAPYGKLTSSDFKELRKKKAKKRSVKEGYSNWREDLSEIVEVLNKDKNDKKIKEKSVNNKIIINPTIDMGDGVRESVEILGGTLLEMIEIDEVDYIVESVYVELLDEGYEEDDIEEALEYALTEAKVTYGHDTSSKENRSRNILSSVGRLARQKLSSKVRGAKKIVSGAVASGARSVAKGALGVARKMEGDKKPSKAHTKTRSASTYRGTGVGAKEKVSSGSYTPPTKKTNTTKQESRPKVKTKSIEDPWGEPTSPPKKQVKPKVKTVTTPVKSLNDNQRQALIRAERRKGGKLSPEDAQRIVSSIKSTEDKAAELRQRMAAAANKLGINENNDDNTPELRSRTVTNPLSSVETGKTRSRKSPGELMRMLNPEGTKKPKKKNKKKKVTEEYIEERTLSSKESREKERIVKSMKNQLSDFEKRYPGRGEEVMYATATKMAKKMAEQYIDEAKLPRSEKKSKKIEKLSGPTRPKHLVQLDLDQAALKEVGSKKRRNPETGGRKTTKVEPAKINVKGPEGNVVRTVSTGDFHKEKLGKGETMDFSPLRDPSKFKQTTKANKYVINKSRGAVIEPNTARGAFRKSVGEEVSLVEDKGKVDNKSIIQHLKNIGYNRKRGMTIKPGHFTGDIPGTGSPRKKLIATKKDIKKYQPQKVSHIDDDPKNLEPLEKHRQVTQGERGQTRGTDPKIQTQLVGSFSKRGESRETSREHGRVRRYSGVRNPGSVTEPVSTKEVQRRARKAKRGMGEAVEQTQQSTTQNQQNTSAINQVLQAKQKADFAHQNLSRAQKAAIQKGVNLSSLSA